MQRPSPLAQLVTLALAVATAPVALAKDPFPNPSNLVELRAHMDWKVNQKYSAGNFYFTRQSAQDKNPALLISSKAKNPIKDAYVDLAKADKAKGEKVAQQNMCAGTYAHKKGAWTFTVTAASRDAATQDLLEDALVAYMTGLGKVTGSVVVDWSASGIAPTQPSTGIDALVEEKLDFNGRPARAERLRGSTGLG